MNFMLDTKHKSSDTRGMNKLPLQTRVQILSMLCEGSSMRSISRVCDVSINTVSKLLVDAGEVCIAYHDQYVRGLQSKRVQCDEIWSFCYAKNKNVRDAKSPAAGAGDVWTWTALDADSKMIISWSVGRRDAESAYALMEDLRSRLKTRVQLTTDGHKAYLEAVEGTLGADVDYAMLIKLYGGAHGNEQERKYSPGECIGAKKEAIQGEPDPQHISTSYVERQNLNMRMGMRRFTRLTNAFSKKFVNHCHALSLYFMFYNFCRLHKTLRVSPAMAAGVSDKLWNMEDIVALIDARDQRARAKVINE
jgi:IS1 family transposase